MLLAVNSDRIFICAPVLQILRIEILRDERPVMMPVKPLGVTDDSPPIGTESLGIQLLVAVEPVRKVIKIVRQYGCHLRTGPSG